MNLDRLLRPASIAFIGGREAAAAASQCDRMGFRGAIWPVNPNRQQLAGRRCFRSVDDLPSAPDAAFVGVNRRAAIGVVAELAAKGCGGAIVFASGFAESGGEGPALQEALVAAAGAMPIIGPNCYGLINAVDRIVLWPDQHGCVGVERGVAIITQSSNIALNLSMQRRRLPVAHLATVGNQAQIDLAEMAMSMLRDPRVSAVGLHIEGFAEPANFERMAALAHRLKKPIVALKVGRSIQGRAVALSHTASIAGSDEAADAFLSRMGAPRLRSLPAFLETLKLLHVHGPLPGADLASMSCSGGEAGAVADAAEGRAVRFRPFAPDHAAAIGATLNELVTVSNPFDYHTFIWAERGKMTATFSAVMRGGCDLTLLILDFPRSDRCDDADWAVACEAMIEAARSTGARAAVVATLPENLPEHWAEALMREGVAPLHGVEDTLDAVEAAAAVGRFFAGPPPQGVLRSQPSEGPAIVLDEDVAKQRLGQFGLTTPHGRRAKDAEDAVRAANEIGYPVAVKALGVAHKTEKGALRLGLVDAAAVRAAATDLAPLGRGLLVESMVAGGVAELIVGVVRDPQIGLLMRIGAGGVLVEMMKDHVALLLPTTDEAVRGALLGLRSAQLLTGYRNRPAADIERLVDAIVAVARFAERYAAELEELDVNPLIACSDRAVAADALIRIREP